jgi:gpW
LTVEELNALKADRVEARQAMHSIAIGDKEVEVMAFGRKRTFYGTNVAALKDYIAYLDNEIAAGEIELGIESSGRRRGGAIGFRF